MDSKNTHRKLALTASAVFLGSSERRQGRNLCAGSNPTPSSPQGRHLARGDLPSEKTDGSRNAGNLIIGSPSVCLQCFLLFGALFRGSVKASHHPILGWAMKRLNGQLVFALAVAFALGNTHCGSSSPEAPPPASPPPSNLAYSANPVLYTVGIAIVPNLPSSSGGAPTVYAVGPALPAGLNLNSTTGVISGTPTVAIWTASYTVTARNSGGSTTASLNIVVVEAGVPASPCTGKPGEPGEPWQSIWFGPLYREYFVHFPPGYDGTNPTPLVMAFHGCPGDAKSMEGFTSIDGPPDRPPARTPGLFFLGSSVVCPGGRPLWRAGERRHGQQCRAGPTVSAAPVSLRRCQHHRQGIGGADLGVRRIPRPHSLSTLLVAPGGLGGASSRVRLVSTSADCSMGPWSDGPGRGQLGLSMLPS